MRSDCNSPGKWGWGDDSVDGKDEVGLRGIITIKEERYAGTSGMWQTDMEMFVGMWDFLVCYICVPGHKAALHGLCS